MFAMLPMILFAPFIRKLSVKYGKKEISVVGALCSVAACALLLVLPVTPDTTGLIIYVGCMLINSLGMGVYSCVSWSLMADAIDYNQWRFGVREEGTVYSLHAFFRKLAQGLGPSLVLVIWWRWAMWRPTRARRRPTWRSTCATWSRGCTCSAR